VRRHRFRGYRIKQRLDLMTLALIGRHALGLFGMGGEIGFHFRRALRRQAGIAPGVQISFGHGQGSWIDWIHMCLTWASLHSA
jgi:hypothetical protein